MCNYENWFPIETLTIVGFFHSPFYNISKTSVTLSVGFWSPQCLRCIIFGEKALRMSTAAAPATRFLP